MPKGSVQDTRVATNLVTLRDKIRELEVSLANLRGRGKRVVALLKLRDEIDEAMARLGQGFDLRPERTRVETIDNILYRKAGAVLLELSASGGLRTAREQAKPPEQRWWWFLDEYVAEKRRRSAIRAITVVLGIAAVLLIGNFAMDRFFGLSPEEKEARVFTLQAEQAIQRGDFDQAIAEYEKALEILPDAADVHLQLGVLYEQEGEETKSEAALRRAEELVGDRARFLTALARMYSDVGLADKALAEVNEAIALNPESAEAFLIRATIHENADEYQLAIDDLDRSADLAQASGQDELYVLARMRLGMLLQRSPGSGVPGMGL